MQSRAKLTLGGLLLAVLGLVFGPGIWRADEAQPPSGAAGAKLERREGSSTPSSVGFVSRQRLEEHFEKHGREFGAIDLQEYLRRAQELRDRAVGGEVLELVRDDGVVTRFDERSGAFVAFNRDKTIRTFFRPADGRRYFERQAREEH